MNEELVTRAMYYALNAHQRQEYGGAPFFVHLNEVFKLMLRFDTWEPILAACWLHDVLEDTHVTAAMLRAEFGAEVTELVQAVTDEPGPTRADRKRLTYPKTRAAGERAVRLKLVDRIANVRASAPASDFRQRYRDEQVDFRMALRKPNENEALWDLLERALVYPGAVSL